MVSEYNRDVTAPLPWTDMGKFNVVKEPAGDELGEVSDSLLICGDAIATLELLPSDSVQTVVTSPPYWSLRDYEVDGQIGRNDSLLEYIKYITRVFDRVRDVLSDDGTVWLNIGDSYTSGNRGYRAPDKKNPARAMSVRPPTPEGLKPKDLIGVPWRLAFALQDAGWYVRSEVVWNKPNCQPESVKDRPTRSHEHVFLLSKSERYLYNVNAKKGPNGRRIRTVWDINTKGFKGAHFAVMPLELADQCIAFTTEPDDFVLDPFAGSGTSLVAAALSGRNFIGIEVSEQFVDIATNRILSETNLRTG